MFTKDDLKQIKERGSDIKVVEQQIKNFIKGFPFVKLVAPATVNNGIIALQHTEVSKYVQCFEHKAPDRNILKFVPASGAASRMFKELFAYLEKCNNPEEAEKAFFKDKSFNSAFNFIDQIEKFAFYQLLEKELNKINKTIHGCQEEKDFKTIIEYTLLPKGLDYANLPKGLIHFHNYNGYPRTAMEEHLVEGANYCRDNDGTVNIHFTISPEHMNKFKQKFEEVKGTYEKTFGVKFKADFSIQKQSTDTISVDMNNQPFRNSDGSLLFRPGGHGALIENLNDIKGDIIFIKNIDNVVPDCHKEETYRYKKALAGFLMELQQKVHTYLKHLEKGNCSATILDKIADFAECELFLSTEQCREQNEEDRHKTLFNMLNRPIRVCGMVKNQGEPGGGPFWVADDCGRKTLQIIESSQINLNDSEQAKIFKQSTHFNPVDLVCAVRDYKDRPFDLTKFVDPNTGFISVKSKDGKELKAQELPGLWNGAMANWITVFIEVPIITFNPVKTVNDLLRPEHQVGSIL